MHVAYDIDNKLHIVYKKVYDKQNYENEKQLYNYIIDQGKQ